MRLSAGSKLGPYEILSPLGAGGMGEVYRGRDTRLGRDVAIKVLPADRLADDSRKRRFVHEARAASALNHPNIVTIHEIESADGVNFIVMELVAGKTLRELIRPGLGLQDALKIAIPVADALAKAHAAGIIHRDLKPANVMVGDDGMVKVLDFGLAKLIATEQANENLDTATAEAPATPLSQVGTILGTPGYLSPEQAVGGKIDSRSDVFSFGALLYEMVTGRRAFKGDTTAETLAKVVREEPTPPSQFSRDVPPGLEKLIQRCLHKEPDRRLQHMGDVKLLLEDFLDESKSAVTAAPSVPQRVARWLGAGCVALLLALAAGVTWRGRASPPAPGLRSITAMAGTENFPTFSPDGNQVAFSWEGEGQGASALHRSIWVKLVGGSEVRRLTSGPGDDWNPSWSPDGSQIAFLRFGTGDIAGDIFAAGSIHVVSALGGADRRLADFPAGFSQLAWSPDGRSLVARRLPSSSETASEASGLFLIPLTGEQPRALTRPDQPGYDMHPAFSPNGRQLAHVSCAGSVTPPCYVYSVDLGDDLAPRADPRRLSKKPGAIHGIAWTRDRRSVIYAVSFMYFNGRGMGSRLWRAAANGETPPSGSSLPSRIVCPSDDSRVFDAGREGTSLQFGVGW